MADTAEEKVAKLYKRKGDGKEQYFMDKDAVVLSVRSIYKDGIYISPEHIELIADLVVSRLLDSEVFKDLLKGK